MIKLKRSIVCSIVMVLTLLVLQRTFADSRNDDQGMFVFQGGTFTTTQGHAQQVNIKGLIGDHFTVDDSRGQNVVLGLGYFIKGLVRDRFSFFYGLNAYYLSETTVQGDVIQEKNFTNLSYHYSLSNYPIYLTTKALFNLYRDEQMVTIDVGVGPNFIRTSNFGENSLDGGVTTPDAAFSGQTNAALSAMLGVGIKFNRLLDSMPCELGYRFFYLGEGSLKTVNSQIASTLKTGNNYASALIFSIYV